VRVRLDGGSLEIDVKPANLQRISEGKGTSTPLCLLDLSDLLFRQCSAATRTPIAILALRRIFCEISRKI
jgi:hypothetical protein